MTRELFKQLILQHEIVNGKRVVHLSIAETDPDTLMMCVVHGGSPDTLDIQRIDQNKTLIIQYTDESWTATNINQITSESQIIQYMSTSWTATNINQITSESHLIFSNNT